MDRRAVITILGGSILAAPLAVEAQSARKMYRIGFLRRTAPEPGSIEAFRQGLRELGYVESESVVIEQRYAYGVYERLPELAADLLRSKGARAARHDPLDRRALELRREHPPPEALHVQSSSR